MNNDLISRAALLKEIAELKNVADKVESEKTQLLLRCLGKGIEGWIKAASAVDAEPVRHAAWTYKDDDVCYWWECNACGSGETMNTAYCPNCGAKMDLEETNDQK